MESQRFDEIMKFMKRAKPFHPFTIKLVNGDSYEVDHADAFMYWDGTAVYAAPGGVPVIFDHQSVSQIIGDLKNARPLETA